MIATKYWGIGPVPVDVWRRELVRVNSPLMTYVEAMHTVAGQHSALCLAMCWAENQYATTGIIIKPTDFNPLSLRPWEEDPRGLPIGATGIITGPDGGKFLKFSEPQHCVAEWRRRLFDDPAYKGGVYTKATSLESMLAIYAPPGDVHPVSGLDNADSGYVTTVVTMLHKYAAIIDGGKPMALKAHTWPGLKNPVYLPDWLKVEVRLIDHPRFTSHNKESGHTRTTWHDTGNPNTNAEAEWKWANGGRQGAGAGGYNGIFDDTKLIISQAFDEEVWAAGSTSGNVGNLTAYAFEQAWGGSANFAKSLEIGAAVHGGLIAAKGWQVDTALVQHNYWTGKHCPGQIRNKGVWPSVVKMTSDAAALARAAAGTVVTTYAKPSPLPELASYQEQNFNLVPAFVKGAGGHTFFRVRDRVEAIKITPRRQSGRIDAATVGPNIKIGERFDVNWIYTAADGREYYISPAWTRIYVGDTKPVADAIPD
ncbi:MAG TPA: hypothetical protein VNJ04_19680 [Gemmatimonadaceae bacterium]|nr:hypothetical protein [Gemmatimonadaceae bacterium]